MLGISMHTFVKQNMESMRRQISVLTQCELSYLGDRDGVYTLLTFFTIMLLWKGVTIIHIIFI